MTVACCVEYRTCIVPYGACSSLIAPIGAEITGCGRYCSGKRDRGRYGAACRCFHFSASADCDLACIFEQMRVRFAA